MNNLKPETRNSKSKLSSRTARSVLDCGSPLPLSLRDGFSTVTQSARRLAHSKTWRTVALGCLLSALGIPLSAFSQSTAFTYQGFLNDGGAPASGIYDLQFTVFDAASSGAVVGGPLDVGDAGVTNGLFTVTLDFGSGVFTGADRWLEIGLRPGASTGAFTNLTPRQPITATPYAIRAASAGTVAATGITGTISSNNIAPGTLGTAMLADGAVTSDKIGGVLLPAQIPDLDAAKITTGTLAEARLPASVSLLGPAIDSAEIVDGTIVNADISPAAAIADGKLATIATAGKVADSALSANVAQLNRPLQTFTGTNVFTQRVGIGTSASASTLRVQGTGLLGDIWLSPTTSGGNADIFLSENTSGSFGIILRHNGSNNVLEFVGVNSSVETTSPVVTIGRGNTSGMDVRNSLTVGGSVGIGTNNPAEKLHVVGSVLATGTVQGQNLSVSGGLMSLGATNLSAIEIKPGSLRALRIEDPGDSADNNILPDGAPNLIGGSPLNYVSNGIVGATIGGGGATNYFGFAYTNRVLGNFGTVGGGRDNTVGDLDGTVGGGWNNTARGGWATVGGGWNNTASGHYAVVAGGYGNIAANFYAIVVGGERNAATTNYATVGGGELNYATDENTTVGGGYYNTASGRFATVGGGLLNHASGRGATIPGGRLNTATNYAFAAGHRAKADHQGAFVWADSTDADIASTTNNSVTFRAAGGYRLFSDTWAAAGVSIAPGGTSWAVISDRNVKKDFAPVDGLEVLEKLAALPMTQWRYAWETAETTPHIGPMAQDFKAAFYPGADDKVITTQEADGVALAAIQGLNTKLESGKQKAEMRMEKLEAENAALKARLEKLEQLLAQQLNQNTP